MPKSSTELNVDVNRFWGRSEVNASFAAFVWFTKYCIVLYVKLELTRNKLYLNN